jgi:hypothetical protein
MVFLLLGVATLAVMMGALGMFSRAQVATVKSFGVWILAIGALALGALLFLTGKGASAIAALALLGPLVWSWMRPATAKAQPGPGSRPGRNRAGGMTRAEAYEVLGLPPGADRGAVQAAYVRLMRAAHPDQGGSDWLAARINQARDILLG